MKLNSQWIQHDSALYGCGFRPFFLLSAGYFVLLTVADGLMVYSQWLPMEIDPLWLNHEWVFGIGLSTISGFLLTAYPAWTDTPRVTGKKLQQLVAIWLLARLAFWLMPLTGVLPLIALNGLFIIRLAGLLTPAVREKRYQKHRLFLYQLLLWLVSLLSFYYVQLTGLSSQAVSSPAELYLQFASAVMMILLLTIFSRMSMVIVNHALKKYQIYNLRHLAKPPRRNFAIGILLLCLALSLSMPDSSVYGWLALAAAAAVMNILNDWHLPKVWRDSYFHAGYGIYVLFALGLCFLGVAAVRGEPEPALMMQICLAVQTMALMLVMLVVGQKHCGADLGYGLAIRLMIYSQLVAAAAEVLAICGVIAIADILIYALNLIGYLLFLWVFYPRFSKPRVDGKPG